MSCIFLLYSLNKIYVSIVLSILLMLCVFWSIKEKIVCLTQELSFLCQVSCLSYARVKKFLLSVISSFRFNRMINICIQSFMNETKSYHKENDTLILYKAAKGEPHEGMLIPPTCLTTHSQANILIFNYIWI